MANHISHTCFYLHPERNLSSLDCARIFFPTGGVGGEFQKVNQLYNHWKIYVQVLTFRQCGDATAVGFWWWLIWQSNSPLWENLGI